MASAVSAQARPQTIDRSTQTQQWNAANVVALLEQPLNDLLFTAHSIHRSNFNPNEVQLSTLLNIKTGGCPEDCAYCPQSARYDTGVDSAALLDVETVRKAAQTAKANGATRFCMGAAWRSPKDRELDQVIPLIEAVKALGLESCVTLGMLKSGQARKLKEAGLDYYNHNLDTSPEFYGEIITTRTYQDRLDTLDHVRDAGINVCCGGIIGMGETSADRAGLLLSLANLPQPPESVPINLLVKVDGTPLATTAEIDALDMVRMVAAARVMMPKSYVRLSAGREEMNDEAQALCFFCRRKFHFLRGTTLNDTQSPGRFRPRVVYEARYHCEFELAHHKDAKAMSAFDERLAAALDEQRRMDRLRTLEPIESAQGRHISIGHQRLLNFSSNDYLGLSAHPALRDTVREAVARYGVGSGASALLSGRSQVHADLEQRLAEYLQRDRALLFSSGYLANLGVVSALVHRHDHIFHDRLNHASLIDAVALTKAKDTRYPHVDMQALERSLDKCKTSGRWIITDAIFSMDGDIAPLDELTVLAKTYDAVLIGDDAHGFGVLAEGRGTAAAFGLRQSDLPIQIVTFGKALGTAGAAVVGSDALIETLIQCSRTFIYDTAPPPMIAAATITALEILVTDGSLHRSLQDNIQHFRRIASDLPLLPSTTPIQPIMIGDDSAALTIAEQLRTAGIYARAIRPPTVPSGTARLRICISATHTLEDLNELVAVLTAAFARLPRC